MILYGMLVPVAVWQVRLRTAISVYYTLLFYLLRMSSDFKYAINFLSRQHRCINKSHRSSSHGVTRVEQFLPVVAVQSQILHQLRHRTELYERAHTRTTHEPCSAQLQTTAWEWFFCKKVDLSSTQGVYSISIFYSTFYLFGGAYGHAKPWRQRHVANITGQVRQLPQQPSNRHRANDSF